MPALRGLRTMRGLNSIVRVWYLVDGQKGAFKGYQNNDGDWVDEQGRYLGSVYFFDVPPDPEDEEETGLEPEEILADAKGGNN